MKQKSTSFEKKLPIIYIKKTPCFIFKEEKQKESESSRSRFPNSKY